MTINGKPIIVVKAELPQRLESIAYNLLAIHPYTDKKDIYPEAIGHTKEAKEFLAKLTPEQKRERSDKLNGFIRVDNCGLPGNEEVYINLFDKFDVKADPRFKNPKTPSIVPVDFKFDFKAFNQKN